MVFAMPLIMYKQDCTWMLVACLLASLFSSQVGRELTFAYFQGTQGTKGNTQVVVPHLTESYASSVDPPATETPVCLLHSFPNNIQHCLQWARELLFEGHFIQEPEVTNNYITQPGFLDSLIPTKKTPTLNTLRSTILERPKSFEDCIAWARRLFEEKYTVQIQQVFQDYL